jgi:hypothetical protein
VSVRRRNRSRSLPIAVAAGLAIGVFGGLMIVRGTGPAVAESSGESVESATKDDDKPAEPSEAGKAAERDGPERDAAERDDTAEGREAGDKAAEGDKAGDKAAEGGTSMTSATVDSRKPIAGTAGDTTATKPELGSGSATLTFDVGPADAVAAAGYSLTVDGASVTGSTFAVTLDDGKKRVLVVAKADGFKTYTRRLAVTSDQTLKIRLRRPSRPTTSGPGSLIDL